MLPARYSARLVSAAFLTVALLVCLVARLLTLSQPVLDIDEAAFAAAAVRAIDRQQPVLQASRDNKPPGIVALYRTAFAVGGIYNMPAVHGLGLLWALLTAGLLWIGCRDFATAAFADFAAGFYLLGTSLDPHFLAFKTELAMNLPLAAAFVLTVAGLRRCSLLAMLLAGAAGGLAFACKQPAAVILAGLGLGATLYCVLDRRRIGRLGWPLLPGSLLLGFVLPLAAIAGWYLWHGAFAALYLQTIALPLDFAGRTGLSLQHRVFRTLTDLVHYIGYSQFLFLPALLGLFAPLLSPNESPDDPSADGWRILRPLLPLTALFALWVLVVAPDLFPAYFMLSFVPLAVGAAALGRLVFGAAAWGAAVPAQRYLLGGGLALMLGFAAVQSWQQPLQLFLHGRGTADALVRTLLAQRAPGDRLYVWGWRPQLYTEARLLPATRYTMTNILIGATGEVGRSLDDRTPQRYYEPGAWDAFMRELAAERPRFIVDAGRMANLDGDYALTSYPRIRDYVTENYDRITVADAGAAILYRRKPGR